MLLIKAVTVSADTETAAALLSHYLELGERQGTLFGQTALLWLSTKHLCGSKGDQGHPSEHIVHLSWPTKYDLPHTCFICIGAKTPRKGSKDLLCFRQTSTGGLIGSQNVCRVEIKL